MKRECLHAERELTVNDLPKNRKEVFFDCIKQRCSILLLLGLSALLFLLPLFALFIVKDLYVGGVYVAFVDGAADEQTAARMIYSANFYSSLIFIPCFCLFGLGLSGIMQVLSRLIWGEGIFFLSDFAEGIKKNGIAYCVTFMIMGLIICLISISFYMNSDVAFLWFVLLDVSVLFWGPVAYYVLMQSVVYKEKYSGLLRNGIILYGKSVIGTLILLICCALPFAVAFVNMIILKYVLLTVVVIIFIPLGGMAMFLYACSVFDRYINVQSYPEIVDKGIYRHK